MGFLCFFTYAFFSLLIDDNDASCGASSVIVVNISLPLILRIYFSGNQRQLKSREQQLLHKCRNFCQNSSCTEDKILELKRVWYVLTLRLLDSYNASYSNIRIETCNVYGMCWDCWIHVMLRTQSIERPKELLPCSFPRLGWRWFKHIIIDCHH